MSNCKQDNLGFINNRLILCLLFLFITTKVFTQNQLIGIHGSLDYGYRNLTTNDESLLNIKEERDFLEYPSLGFTLGGNYSYRKNKTALLLEAQYSVRGYDENNTGQPQNSTFIPVDYQTFYYYRFIDAGIAVNQYLSDQKLSIFLTLGLRGSYFLSGEERRVDYFDGTLQQNFNPMKEEEFISYSFKLFGGLGFGYQHTDELIFRFSPIFKYGLSSITNSSMNERLYSGSIQITAMYKLKKR